MKLLFTILFSFFFMSGVFSQTRNVLVNTNSVVVQPTNFWSADASNARVGLGLGSIATSSITSFQPSSAVLSNLASGNGVNITNLRATNLVGIISIANGGTGETNTTNARIALGLGTAATNNASEFQGSSSVLSNLASSNGINITNLQSSNLVGLISISNVPVVTLTNISGVLAVASGGTGATNSGQARTNLGATSVGSSIFTATNQSAVLDILGISTNISTTTLSVSNIQIKSFPIGSGVGFIVPTVSQTLRVLGTNVTTSVPAFYGWSGFESTAFSAAQARTNIGLTLQALTNTNTSGFNASLYGVATNPVLVNDNGIVVSPTNFWQVAPIQTLVYNFAPLVSSSTNILGARNIYVYSSSTNVSGVTSTIVLPTNGSTFVGDVATIIHRGLTSTVTAIKQEGATNNIISISNYDEAVKFIHEDGDWLPYHNISFVEPIRFSGTNTALNAAGSRTNLGLGTTNSVTFNTIVATSSISTPDLSGDNITVEGAIYFTEVLTNVGVTRTNLGLPLATLTNTNNAKFQQELFTTNAPTNAANFGDHVTWLEVFVLTNGVTNSFKIPLYK